MVVCERETVEEGFVLDVGVHEHTIIGPFTLGVGGRKDDETSSRSDPLTGLLEEDTLTLKDRLEAHDGCKTQIHLVKEQNGTTLHGFDDWTIDELGLTIHQPEPTEEIILIGLGSDVDAEHLTLELGTDLLDHGRLAITRQTSHIDIGIDATPDDLLDVLVVTPCHIVIHDGWDHRRRDHRKGIAVHVNGSRCTGSRSSRMEGRVNGFLDHLLWGHWCDVTSICHFRDIECTTPFHGLTGLVLHNPCRRILHAETVSSLKELLTAVPDPTSRISLIGTIGCDECVDEGRLLGCECLVVHAYIVPHPRPKASPCIDIMGKKRKNTISGAFSRKIRIIP